MKIAVLSLLTGSLLLTSLSMPAPALAQSGGGGWDFEGKSELEVRDYILQAVQASMPWGQCASNLLSELIAPVAREARAIITQADSPLTEAEADCLDEALAQLPPS